MNSFYLNRRTLLKGAASAALAAPFVRRANAAGDLKCAFIDHWVPGANDVLTELCQSWAEQEKVNLTIDFVTTSGDAITNVGAAESLAKTGHDIITTLNWATTTFQGQFEPVDDIMADLIAEHGAASPAIEYVGLRDGHWTAVPSVTATQGAPCGTRIDLFKEHVGLDVTQMYPNGAPANQELADKWTWDFFLEAAQKCAKAGVPFGMGLGRTPDSVNWVGSVFAAHNAQLISKDGEIIVNSDEVRKVLEWFVKLVPSLPDGVFSWDDSANNKWLISGKGALVMNSPSAWAVANRDAPEIGKQIWHMPPPKGPNGRFMPRTPSFWGIWEFSQNKEAAKGLLRHLWQRDNVAKLVSAGKGNDIPAFPKLLDFKTWEEAGPPAGTLYHYPPRDDVIAAVAGMPAPASIASQAFSRGTLTNMIARAAEQGGSIDAAITWAEDELSGFMRG